MSLPPVSPPAPPQQAVVSAPVISQPNVVSPPIPEKLAYAVAAGAGASPTVALYSAENTLIGFIAPFDASYRGGVRIATADVNKDGYLDVIAASGIGDPSRVQVWDGQSKTLLFDVDPFGGFKGGLFVAAGDFNGDGYADVVVVPDAGGGPRVQTWSGKTLTKLTPDFFGIDAPSLMTGLRVAAGDINNDGHDDLAFVPGPGGGPRVSIFDGQTFSPDRQPGKLVGDFFMIDPRLQSGIYITVGDVNGDGFAEVIASADKGGGPRVQVVDGYSLAYGGIVPIADFYAGDPANSSGVRVATAAMYGQKQETIVAATGTGSRVYLYPGTELFAPPVTTDRWFDAFPDFSGGVFVG